MTAPVSVDSHVYISCSNFVLNIIIQNKDGTLIPTADVTKIKVNQDPSLNTETPGYVFVSQPTLSNAGGVVSYIRNDLFYIIREN